MLAINNSYQITPYSDKYKMSNRNFAFKSDLYSDGYTDKNINPLPKQNFIRTCLNKFLNILNLNANIENQAENMSDKQYKNYLKVLTKKNSAGKNVQRFSNLQTEKLIKLRNGENGKFMEKLVEAKTTHFIESYPRFSFDEIVGLTEVRTLQNAEFIDRLIDTKYKSANGKEFFRFKGDGIIELAKLRTDENAEFMDNLINAKIKYKTEEKIRFNGENIAALTRLRTNENEDFINYLLNLKSGSFGEDSPRLHANEIELLVGLNDEEFVKNTLNIRLKNIYSDDSFKFQAYEIERLKKCKDKGYSNIIENLIKNEKLRNWDFWDIVSCINEKNKGITEVLCADDDFPTHRIPRVIRDIGNKTESDIMVNAYSEFKRLNPNLKQDRLYAFTSIFFDLIHNMTNIQSLNLKEKIGLYNELLTFSNQTKEFYLKSGIDVNETISKLATMLGSKKDVIQTPKNQQQKFLTDFLVNNNSQSEKLIKEFDFAKYEKNGLPLEYSRDKFNNKVEKLLSKLSPEDQNIVLEHFGLIRGIAGFDGLPTNKEFVNETVSDETKRVSDKIRQEINSFTLDNKVLTGDKNADNVLTSLVQGLPEFTSIVGKKQHGTHAYSVDIHTLKVLQSAMNNPIYETLSDKGKTILKMSALLHDTGKRGGVVDTGHAELSADYAAAILKKFQFSSDVNDRVIDIVENHHWFEAYNKGNISAQDVAVRCRRPEDFKIYEILSKADFENVNPNFHLMLSGTKNQSEFDKFMQNKMVDIQKNLDYIYENVNLVFDTKFVRNGIFFPKEEVSIDGEKTQLKVLNFNKLKDNENLQKYGFASNVTKNNARFFVHMTHPEKEFMDPVVMLTNNSLNQSVWSASLISPTFTKTFANRSFGFIFDIDQANISEAFCRNIISGQGKNIDDYKKVIFNKANFARAYVRNILFEKLKNDGIELSDEEYGNLAKQLSDKKYLTQLRSDIKIGDKVIKHKDLVKYLESSRDELFTANDSSEIVAINPKVKGLIAKVKKLEDCPEEFLRFAKEHDLPVVLVKPTDK